MKKLALEIEGREIVVTNPDKVFFPRTGHTKIDLVNYYLAVADGALRGVYGRPMAMKRFVNGAESTPFFQTADEIVVRDAAQLAWVINLGCIDLNPHPVRAEDVDQPDELRVDLDPVRGVAWPQVRDVALVTRAVLEDFGLVGWPKTSGSRGFHVYCRIEPRWTFPDVRRAAVALAREVERRAPDLATSKWWKEERHGVFVDYNQNAKDHTTASAYSVRPSHDARVSAPLHWDEVADCDPATFTIDTVPDRFARLGDPADGIDSTVGSLEGLLELAERQALTGVAEAPAPGNVPLPAPGKAVGPTGRRRTTAPLIEIARAATQNEAFAGLERWKLRHADVWPRLEPNDILVDSMRGRNTTWTRIRVNLRHVPEAERPPQEALEVDYDPWHA